MEVYRLNNELYHHGVKGQRWGVRRYQNEDGSLKDASKKRYVASTLKRNEIRYGEENSRRAINKDKFEKFTKKSNKAKEKGNAEKAKNFKDKAKKYEKLMNASIKEMKAAESANWKTIAKAVENGYDIKIGQGKGLYYSKKGRNMLVASQALFGLAGNIGAATVMSKDTTGKYSTNINTYKVKKRDDGKQGNARFS